MATRRLSFCLRLSLEHRLRCINQGPQARETNPSLETELMGRPILSSVGKGKSCGLSMKVPKTPSPILDNNRAPSGSRNFIQLLGAGVWWKASKAFPDSSSVQGVSFSLASINGKLKENKQRITVKLTDH